MFLAHIFKLTTSFLKNYLLLALILNSGQETEL